MPCNQSSFHLVLVCVFTVFAFSNHALELRRTREGEEEEEEEEGDHVPAEKRMSSRLWTLPLLRTLLWLLQRQRDKE